MRWPLIKHLPDKTNLKFVGPSRIFAVISIVAVIGSLFLSLYPLTPPCGGLNCGVDFKGGTVIDLSTPGTDVDLQQVRKILNDAGMNDVAVQGYARPGEDAGTTHNANLRFETPEGQSPDRAVEGVKARLKAAIPDARFSRTEVVGPKVSGELFQKGIWALLAAIGCMLIYIWFRFGLTFGIGAVAGLFHDVILTFGLFAVLQLEFTMVAVASILTIIGYSMNDTVVVLDRIRENLRKYKKMPLSELIDLSINETLSRTIITGITGLMALTGLAVLGGQALYAFSVSMVFGIIVGTYSSIFVAAPILLMLGVRRGEEAEPIDLTKGTSVKPQRP